MDRQNEQKIEWWNYALLGIVLAAFLLFLFLNPRKGNDYATHRIEVVIVQKEIANMDGKDIYLIHGEDRYGESKDFQITDAALNGHFNEADVYQEIKTGKYYNFKYAEKEAFDSYYPSICGAVKLIEGFSPEPENP